MNDILDFIQDHEEALQLVAPPKNKPTKRGDGMTNKELDIWIAENVMGWQRDIHNDCWLTVEPKPFPIAWWNPTESDSDVFQMVDKNIDNPRLQFSGLQLIKGQEGYFWEAKYYNGQTMHYGRAEIRPLAICQAIKKAVEEME